MKAFFQMIGQYIPPYRRYLGGAVVLNMLSAVFNIFSFAVLVPLLHILFTPESASQYAFLPWDTADTAFKDILVNNVYWYVATYSATHGAGFTLLLLCLVMIGFTALKTACYFGSAAVMIPIRTGIVRDIRNRIYEKIVSLPLGYFTEARKGDILARFSGDVSEVEYAVTSSVEMLIKDPILILFYFGTLLFLSPEMTLFIVLFVPGFVWVMGLVGKQLRRQSLEAQGLWSEALSQVEETLGGLRIVKAFLAEGRMKARFSDVTEKMRRKVARVSTRQALAHPMSEFLGTVLIMLVLLVGGSLILRGRGLFGGPFLDASQFIFYMVILYSVIEPIKELSKAAYGIPKGLASLDRINGILTAENPIREVANPLPLSDFREEIVFRDVHFSYADKEILRGIDLRIPRGRMVALVGESGAGKSTLADLLPRFYDVSAGSITLDGKDISRVRIRDLRALIGYVNQDPILFNDTIFHNIAFGVEGATQADVEAAARIANAHEFILEKEQGYLTPIGDRGVKLSGGQRQRLSIARAILKNPPILILDEATASLDTESERAVQEALDRLMRTRTTLVIAHRLSTIRHADEILVLHEGVIAERGTHEALLEKGGYYKKLYDMQSL